MRQIIDVTDFSGSYINSIKNGSVLALGLDQLGAIRTNVSRDSIYVTQPRLGTIMKVSTKAKRNYHFDAPVVKGFKYPTCLRFSKDEQIMYVCDQGAGCVWRVEDFE
jgi:hypothetical protein